MIEENSRIEKKFVLEESRQDYFKRFLLVNNFKKLYPDRVINSIYIDTLGFDFAKDNINGVGVRKKIRFRWYNNNYDQIFIEEKNKRNFNVWKRIRKLTLPKNKKNLINNLKDYLYKTSLLSLNNYNYKFVLKTNYKRSYWISSNNKIRATIDIDINTCSFNNFFQTTFSKRYSFRI